jgi:hypothetical protein
MMMMVGMEINSEGNTGGHNPLEIGNLQQPPRAEASHKRNGFDSERKKSDWAGSQPLVGFVQHEEVQVEDITGQPKLGWEEEEPEVGTSSVPTHRKGKHPIA